MQRIREAIENGESVLTDSQVEFIKHHAAVLGEDGRDAMREIQQKATEPGCLPADIARITEGCCKDLGRRAMLWELYNDLEKAALDLTKNAMEYLNGIGRDVGTEGEDALGPLRRVFGMGG